MNSNVSVQWDVICLVVINALIALGNLAMIWITKRIANSSTQSAKAQEDQNTALIMLDCLRLYNDIQKDRTKAKLARSVDMAKDYYREMMDLHWTEYYLWKRGMIFDNVMKLWLSARHRNHENDEITIDHGNGQTESVSYRDEWRHLRDSNYFAPLDPFKAFIGNVHDGEIDEAMKK